MTAGCKQAKYKFIHHTTLTTVLVRYLQALMRQIALFRAAVHGLGKTQADSPSGDFHTQPRRMYMRRTATCARPASARTCAPTASARSALAPSRGLNNRASSSLPRRTYSTDVAPPAPPAKAPSRMKAPEPLRFGLTPRTSSCPQPIRSSGRLLGGHASWELALCTTNEVQGRR